MLVIGRRAGKTSLLQDLALEPEVLRDPVGWFAPTYKELLEVWREMSIRMAPITKRSSAADKRIENIAGGVLEFWSLADVNAGRSRRYKRVLIDECAFVPHLLDAWNFSIRPTLIDLSGDAWFASTPKGRNGFFQLARAEAAGEAGWRTWQMPSSVNPFLPLDELESMRKAMPERVYAQEILAQFLDDAGGVFRHVVEAATATLQESPIPGHDYAMGVDWARDADWTVFTVIDITTREVVSIDRFNQIDYSIQLDRLRTLHDRFRPRTVIAEANAMGQPMIDMLQRTRVPVQPFTTTNATKAVIIDALTLAFEQGQLRIPADNLLINELQSFEMERLPSGLIRYAAPEGSHDDMVMSLALAWQAVAMNHSFAGHANPFYM